MADDTTPSGQDGLTEGAPPFQSAAPQSSPAGPAIDTSVPHSARIWNYWMGGKDNYPIDREVGSQVAASFPEITALAQASRAFLVRVVRHLAQEAGIRQFLDIGTGMPTLNNTHEVAQSVAPDSRVVYVDNDPLVLTHARALLAGTPEGVTAYLDADLRDPDTILARAKETLDFDQPVALLLFGILGHLPDEDVLPTVRRLVDALPSGSYLAIYDGTNTSPAYNTAMEHGNAQGGVPYLLRAPEDIAARFTGLVLLEPGVVPLPQWRPEPTEVGTPGGMDQYGGVARKP